MLGAYSYLIELWGSPNFDADENGDGRVSDEEYLKWSDIELTGEGWIVPHQVDHPDLGKIWIGGTRQKHVQRTPPARYIESEAMRNTHFVLYCANQFPKVEFGDFKVIPSAHNLFWVEVEVKNLKVYPTSSDRAVKLKRAVMDKITVTGSSGVKPVDIPEGDVMVDPLNPATPAKAVVKKGTEFRLKGMETLRFCALVEMSGSDGWVEFKVNSRHGGDVVKRIRLKIAD